MIVPDTSVWVEYTRGTGHAVHLELRRLINDDAEIVLTEIIAIEVLAGARSDAELVALESLMSTYPMLQLNGIDDYEEAAALFRACRARGETIRNLTDCLIAVPVIHEAAELLHNDSDFEAIARHSDLRLYAGV